MRFSSDIKPSENLLGNKSDDTAISLFNEIDKSHFNDSIKRLEVLCEKASEIGISLLLDAEQSYRQPAIEVIARKVCPSFNLPGKQPVLFNTYQMYLKRSQQAVEHDIQHAHDHQYIFAAKIVRGAYILTLTPNS